jgi:hypothetical protein
VAREDVQPFSSRIFDESESRTGSELKVNDDYDDL